MLQPLLQNPQLFTKCRNPYYKMRKLLQNASLLQNAAEQQRIEKELCDAMMKLEGKRPMCWSFVSERLSQQHVMKLWTETHQKLIEKNTRRSLQRTTKSCGAHVFGVHRICIYSRRGREKRH